MEILELFVDTLLNTLRDVIPIFAIIIIFQVGVLKKRLYNKKPLIIGAIYVLLGLTCFLVGLEYALFPLGRTMAEQLTNPLVAEIVHENDIVAARFVWVYLFAFAIGFATTIAEPSLIAVALKAQEVSGGTVKVWGLRIAVALGVGIGITLGVWRIIIGAPIHYFIIVGYIIVVVQTVFAPRMIIPLAYDSGGVTTSTVTVPLVAALGLGLAESIPGRNPLIDGFGLIAFASLFPMITVMGYAQLTQFISRRQKRKEVG